MVQTSLSEDIRACVRARACVCACVRVCVCVCVCVWCVCVVACPHVSAVCTHCLPPPQVLGGLEPTALSDLMLEPDSHQYRYLTGGGEASKITKQDKSLFSQAKSAMRVRGGEGRRVGEDTKGGVAGGRGFRKAMGCEYLIVCNDIEGCHA